MGQAANAQQRRPDMLVGVPLNSRHNSLNLVRLVLASSVIVHHSWPLTGSSFLGPDLAGDGIGGWAVTGFFCLSGYLITGSRFSKSFGDYLALRIARIYPAFLLCMVLTALVFAPVNYLHARGSLDGFLTAKSTPFNYVFANLGLKMNAWDVAGTPLAVPYPHAWNGSLWTLYYEFACYLLLGFLGLFAVVRRSPWPIAGVWAASVGVRMFYPRLAPYFGAGADLELLSKLVPYFMAGAVLQVFKRRIGMHAGVAWASFAVFLGLLLFNHAWGGHLASPLLAYFLLWLGHALPSPAWVRKHDVSYGMYIYGFPAQQLVMTFWPSAGFWGLTFAALALAAVCACASWFGFESPIINRVRDSLVKEHATPAPPVPKPGEAPTLS